MWLYETWCVTYSESEQVSTVVHDDMCGELPWSFCPGPEKECQNDNSNQTLREWRWENENACHKLSIIHTTIYICKSACSRRKCMYVCIHDQASLWMCQFVSANLELYIFWIEPVVHLRLLEPVLLIGSPGHGKQVCSQGSDQTLYNHMQAGVWVEVRLGYFPMVSHHPHPGYRGGAYTPSCIYKSSAPNNGTWCFN